MSYIKAPVMITPAMISPIGMGPSKAAAPPAQGSTSTSTLNPFGSVYLVGFAFT